MYQGQKNASITKICNTLFSKKKQIYSILSRNKSLGLLNLSCVYWYFLVWTDLYLFVCLFVYDNFVWLMAIIDNFEFFDLFKYFYQWMNTLSIHVHWDVTMLLILHPKIVKPDIFVHSVIQITKMIWIPLF
jgi:hypothetical protein